MWNDRLSKYPRLDRNECQIDILNSSEVHIEKIRIKQSPKLSRAHYIALATADPIGEKTAIGDRNSSKDGVFNLRIALASPPGALAPISFSKVRDLQEWTKESALFHQK